MLLGSSIASCPFAKGGLPADVAIIGDGEATTTSCCGAMAGFLAGGSSFSNGEGERFLVPFLTIASSFSGAAGAAGMANDGGGSGFENSMLAGLDTSTLADKTVLLSVLTVSSFLVTGAIFCFEMVSSRVPGFSSIAASGPPGACGLAVLSPSLGGSGLFSFSEASVLFSFWTIKSRPDSLSALGSVSTLSVDLVSIFCTDFVSTLSVGLGSVLLSLAVLS